MSDEKLWFCIVRCGSAFEDHTLTCEVPGRDKNEATAAAVALMDRAGMCNISVKTVVEKYT